MKIKSNLKITIGLSVFIHIGFLVLLNTLANQISFLEPTSITSVDLTNNDLKSKQGAAVKQMKIKAADLTKKTATQSDQLSQLVEASESQLGSDEISNQSQISSPAKLISVVRAERTPEAKKANYVADAKVLIIVNQQGVVDSAKLLNSLEYGLNEVALDIARKLKFRPARIGFLAVRTQIELTINFKSSN